MPVIYKTLFEVKLMHEYYFTTKEGNAIFEEVTQEDRLNFLKNQYEIGSASVNNELQFDFPAPLKTIYDSYYLRILPAYSGFKVAVRVNKKTLTDETVVYYPFVPLPGDLSIKVVFTKKNNSIDRYTNSRINTPLPSVYFFSNEKMVSGNPFPFLTNTVSEFNISYSYEQGELVSFGDNDIRGFFQRNTGDQWQEFKGTGFANENDRLLLPFKFIYSFPEESNITESEFILKSGNGNIIKSSQSKNAERIRKTMLDFSDKQEILSVPASSREPLFTLEVTGNNYRRTHFILFSNMLYNNAVWGATSFISNPSNPDFRLVDADGYLITRKKITGEDRAPVFEIPVKSRFTYLRYINEQRKKIKLTTEHDGYLEREDPDDEEEKKNLLTTRPRTFSKYYFKLKKEGSGLTKYFPGPVNNDLTKDKSGRWCCDIIVPTSGLFPVS